MSQNDKQLVALGNESALALGYFAVYLVYMFIRPENEAMHWLTLVAIPIAVLYIWQRRSGGVFGECIASIGLRRGSLGRGLFAAAVLGVVLNLVQLFVSNRRDEIWQLLGSSEAFLILPMIFLLLLFTAGFTEEVFFRGVLQTRLSARYHWAVAVGVTTLLFSVYHVPYAYLNPNWPSYGDFPDAVVTAFAQGIPGGLVLGILYEKSRNLLAPILLHSLINLLPASVMINVSFG